MIKFFLHGGKLGDNVKENTLFLNELIKGASTKTPVILLVYFARDESEWKDLYKIDVERIKKLESSRNLSPQYIIASKNKLENEIKSSDIIIIRGGEVEPLIKEFKKIKDLKTILDDKIIAGSSAGAIIFCNDYYNPETKSIIICLKIIGRTIVVHYDESVKNELNKLISQKDKNKLLKLKEYQFEIVLVK